MVLLHRKHMPLSLYCTHYGILPRSAQKIWLEKYKRKIRVAATTEDTLLSRTFTCLVFSWRGTLQNHTLHVLEPNTNQGLKNRSTCLRLYAENSLTYGKYLRNVQSRTFTAVELCCILLKPFF